MNFNKQLKDGLIYQNPVLVQVLGMCSTMAITTSVANGFGMGISVLIILTLSNIFISLLRKIIPNEVRIACYIVVIAGFVTIVDLCLQAFVPDIAESLGVFIPLIVVNCIILGRAEAFASKNSVAASAVDGICQGIPGKSNAFAISKRLGLSEAVIEKAKAQMDSESIRFEDVLTQLEQKRQQLEKEKAEVDRLYAQREEDARKAREFRTQMERAKENARSRGEAEAKRLLAEAKSVADDTFRELDALRKQQKKLDAQQMNAQRAEIMHNIKQARDAAGVRDESAEPIPKPSRPIEVGDLVEIPGTRRQAEVTAVKDGTLTLKAGVLQMKVKAGEVRLIEAAERAATAKKQPQFAPSQRILRTASAARELDIRGMETLEAESVLDNYIDAAVMAHLETVTIIHGKGTGALRKAVHASLRRNKAVKSFRLGNYGEGESGVTVVELK